MTIRVITTGISLIISLSILLSISSPAVAVLNGAAETAKLAELISEAKKRLKQLKEQADELKIMSDSFSQAKELLKNIKTEYNYASHFDPERELQDLFDEFKEFEDLYSIKELIEEEDDDEKIDILLDELDKRIVGSDKAFDNEIDPSYIKSLEKRREALIKLKQHYAEYALSSQNKHLSTKDLALINASSSAVLAAEVMERKQKEVEAEIQEQINRIYELEIQNDMLMFYRSTGDKTTASKLEASR